jgi:hypothetical protein
MSRRFEQVRPTPENLARLLDMSGCSMREFSYLTGVDPRRVERWVNDPKYAEDIPQWVAGFLIALGDAHVRSLIRSWADKPPSREPPVSSTVRNGRMGF